MREYIIDTEKINELNRGNVTSWLSPYAISYTSFFPPIEKETHFAVTLPEIVRCRDCKHYEPYPNVMSGEEMAIGDCWKHGRETNNDRFCAWGERK